MSTNAKPAILGEWRRVSEKHPCPVCGQPGGCLYTGDDAAPTACLCCRVESPRKITDGVWLHTLRTDGPAWPAWRVSMRKAANRANELLQEMTAG